MVLLAAVALVAQPASPSTPAATTPAKHPTITEVLYAVPGRTAGDANQDGKRSSGGDEFFEVANLTDAPLQLKGYKILDSNAWEAEQVFAKKTTPEAAPTTPPASTTPPAAPATGLQPPATKREGSPRERPAPDAPGQHVRFIFPDLTLAPGEVAVVFNGFESAVPPPVGSAAGAAAKNPKFSNAYVFSMQVTSQYAALGNEGDWVLLVAPDGSTAQALWWGSGKVERPTSITSWTELSSGDASTHLDPATGKFAPHRSLRIGGTASLFSPGALPTSVRPATPTPVPEKTGK